MDLRSELRPPPPLDHATVARLADQIDGANPGRWEDQLAEFNGIVETKLSFENLQGIYGGEVHETSVRRLLTAKRVSSTPNVTQAELIEIVRRAMAHDPDPAVQEAFTAIFDAIAGRRGASI